jgi:hypothetical protein
MSGPDGLSGKMFPVRLNHFCGTSMGCVSAEEQPWDNLCDSFIRIFLFRIRLRSFLSLTILFKLGKENGAKEFC